MLLEDVQTGGPCGDNLTWPSGATPAPPRSLSIRGHWKVLLVSPEEKLSLCFPVIYLWPVFTWRDSNLNSMWLSGCVLMHSMHTGCQRHPVKDLHWHYRTARSPIREAQRLSWTSCGTEYRLPDLLEKPGSLFPLHFKSSSSLTQLDTNHLLSAQCFRVKASAGVYIYCKQNRLHESFSFYCCSWIYY